MNATSAPIDIRGSRWSSATSSPRLHASNLTTALRDAGAVDDSFPIPDAADVAAALAAADGRQQQQQRQQQSQQAGSAASRAGDYPLNTASGMSWLSSGARPISVKERPRRESNTGSVNGMSWSAMSVGSWIKDE
jgi:transcription factor SFP1